MRSRDSLKSFPEGSGDPKGPKRLGQRVPRGPLSALAALRATVAALMQTLLPWRDGQPNCRLAEDAELGQVQSGGRVTVWSLRTSEAAVVRRFPPFGNPSTTPSGGDAYVGLRIGAEKRTDEITPASMVPGALFHRRVTC
jgi:hypothetical protein